MSVMSPPTDRDDHLRHLLDQRAARADLHGRFPSLSEFSDSPSVYSRAHFSPRSTERAQLDAQFDLVVPLHARAPPSEPRSPMSDRDRLNLPNASSLDLDDDPRSSYEFSNSHEGDDLSTPEDEEELPRINMYGPKMTVHSRAPWELGEDDIVEQDEREVSGPKRSKNKKGGDGGKRVWGLGKGSNEKRPSTDSNRSTGKPKQSLDSFTNNGGALLALAQASMSSTSLALASSPQPTLRDKLSLSRLRSRTPSNPSGSNLEPIDTRLPPFPPQPANTSPMSRLMRNVSPAPLSPLDGTFSDSSSRASTPNTPQHEYIHPYANPDLVSRVTHNPPSPLPSPKQVALAASSASSVVNRSDSNATLTDTATTSSMFQSRSNTTVSSLTPVTSLSSVNPSVHEYSPTRMQGKGISAPITVNKIVPPPPPSLPNGVANGPSGAQEMSPKMRSRDTKLASGASSSAFPGWNESSVTSSIKLISLEEAQAQARERSRSATANPAISSGFAAGPSKTQASAPEPDPQSQSTSARVRSSSASGAKVKPDPSQRPPMPSDSANIAANSVPARLVTRKKSGFMRLFNAKERDRALYSPPPPVPSLSTETVNMPLTHTTSHPPRTRKASTHRVPVPSLSPSLLGDVSTGNADSGNSSDSPSDASGSKESLSRERQLSARRNTPGLSIVTSSSMMHTSKLHPGPPFTSISEYSPHGHTVTITPTAEDSFSSVMSNPPIPNSAPPGTSDFVALSLRPVSTLFSTNFADQLASPRSRPSLDIDHGTPTTATTAVSPLSVDFQKAYSSASDDKSVPIIAQDDQSSVINTLQEQILVARKAWQRQIWELEGQVRDLKAEVDDLRAEENCSPYCSACGRGSIGRPGAGSNTCVEELKKAGVKVGGVVNRPRARTGVGSRFASGT